MFKRSISFLGLLFVPILGLRAQDGTQDTLSLQECINYGLSNSYEVKKSTLDEAKAGYQIKEVTSSGLPQVNAYANMDYYVTIPTQVIPGEVFGQPGESIPVQFGKKHNATAGVKANQLIFNQSYLIGLRAARTSREFYSLLSEQSEENVIYDISMNYYATLESELQLKNLLSNFERLKRLQEIVKAQYENDLARKVEYNRIQVSVVTLQSQMSSLESAIQQRKNYLKLLMGMPVSTPVALDESEFTEASDLSLLSADTSTINDRMDIKLIRKQSDLYELDMLNKRAGYYPTLNAFADYNYSAIRDEFSYFDGSKDWYNSFIVGLRLNIPIFDGFQKKNSIAQSKVDLMKLEQDMNMAKQSAIMEIENSAEQLENSLSLLQAQKDNLNLAEDVYDETSLLYKEDLANLTDLLDAETALREARSAYFTQVLQSKTAYIDLLKAQGEINKINN